MNQKKRWTLVSICNSAEACLEDTYAFLFLQCLLKPRVDKEDRQAVGYQENADPQRKQAVGYKKYWSSRKETDFYLPNARGNLQIMKPWQKQQLL